MDARAVRFSSGSLLLLCALATGCDEELVTSPPDAGPTAPDGGAGPVDAVDLLFVIDNSGSMLREQARMEAPMKALVRALTLGDRSPELPAEPDRSNRARYFAPVQSLHVGVVSANLGGVDNPPSTSEASSSCAGLGDQGKLQHGTSIAKEGVVASTDREFLGYLTDDVVIAPDPSCALDALPPYLAYAPGGATTSEQVAQSLGCVARLGVRGCSFVQPLEAMWKALAPSQGQGPLYEFLNGSRGQGDGYNAGFLREDALLAVVLISDEDDCSVTQAGKLLIDPTRGAEAEQKYGSDIQLRCGQHASDPSLVRPVERYVAALTSLKPGHPERILFAAIVGVPKTAAGLSPEQTLALPELQFRQEGDTGLPAASCMGGDPLNPLPTDKAEPPRRVLELAEALGDNAVVHSICADDYTPALAKLTDRFALQMPL